MTTQRTTDNQSYLEEARRRLLYDVLHSQASLDVLHEPLEEANKVFCVADVTGHHLCQHNNSVTNILILQRHTLII